MSLPQGDGKKKLEATPGAPSLDHVTVISYLSICDGVGERTQ
jgi:hypothetical protein